MVRSEFITGRSANKRAFQVSLEGLRSFVVGAFTCTDGRTMYGDAVFIGKRENYKGYPTVRRKTRVLYRVIVTPKESGSHDPR